MRESETADRARPTDAVCQVRSNVKSAVIGVKTTSLHAPFSILLVLADFYTLILVAYVYIYEKRSLIDYLPMPDEYDLP